MSFPPALPSKLYVYNVLVKEEDNPEHILAYALYKVHKNAIIKESRTQGWTPSQLSQKLQSLHDSVIQQTGMQLYFYQQAQAFADNVVRETKARIRKDAVSEYLEKIEQHQRIITSRWVKFGKWLLGGLSGLMASFVVVFIFGGISFFLLGKEGRTQVGAAAGRTIIDMINPDLPIVDYLNGTITTNDEQEATQRHQNKAAP